MSLPHFAVKQPVTVKMIVFGVILLGAISLTRLPQELFPAVEYPQITVATTYQGAAPEEIEMLITKLIEESVGTVSGVKHLRSISKEALSLVMIEFNWGQDMDLASMAVREKIDLIKERLPHGCNEPIVVRYNPFELPVIVINVTGEYPSSELREFSRTILKNELEKIDGVASCALAGGSEKEIKIEVDQARLTASSLSITDVVSAIKKSNLNYPAGTIKEAFYEQLIRTVGEFKEVSEIKDVPVYIAKEASSEIAQPHKDKAVMEVDESSPTLAGEKEYEKSLEPGQKIIFIKDIATVEEGLKEKSSVSRYNGQETISLSIQKRAGANAVKVADRIKARLKELNPTLPKGLAVAITYDQSLFIKQAVRGVSMAAVQGGILAFLVLFLFLRSIRSALIVAMSIPISVMATFSAMYFKGVSINMISLGGLALGIGMLVDNAIVVIENITRRRQGQEEPKDAASEGTLEVCAAISSSTITTIIVFLPMVFIAGVAGQLFKELAFTVIFSLTASLFVALTLIPSLAKDIKERTQSPKPKAQNLKPLGHSSMENFYRNYLETAITKRRGEIIVKITFLFFIALIASRFLNKEFMPSVDQGQFAVKVELTPGATLQRTDEVASKLEKYLLKDPSVKTVTLEIGGEKEKESTDVLKIIDLHQARLLVNLKPRRPFWVLIDFLGNYRTSSSKKIIQELKSYLSEQELYGAQIEYILQESIFQAALSGEAPVAIEIKGFDLEYLSSLASIISEKLKNMPGLYGIKDSLVLPSPESRIEINKDKAALLGLSVSDIALTTQTAVEGKVATKFKREGKEIDIRVRLREADREDVGKLRRLFIRGPSDENIVLADVASVVSGRGPTQIIHDNKERVVRVWANLYKRSLSSATQSISREIAGLDLKQNYSVKLAGETLQMRESFRSLVFALLLSLVLVYMVMAAQFESFKQPFIIMFTIPLALIGVVAGLLLSGTNLSVMVFLGAIVLGGVVVNNGIVLIDYINRLKDKGYAKKEAVLEAAVVRLRPILMTAATTVLGLLPLALGLSEGAQLQKPLAITIMAGLFISTFLSLVVIPILYLE